jgi:putative SOS response-associated peptidase YedK
MCGRYFLTTPGEVLANLFETAAAPDLAPRYNIAPTQTVPIVRAAANGAREIALVSWGLVPHWAKERAIGNKLINARGETLAEKPSFRDAYRKRRCLLPADGYFEWKRPESGGSVKQPYAFRARDGRPFALAGLWSSWKDPASGETLESCAIVTTSPNELAATVHDRMPVIVAPERFELWLGAGAPTADFASLLEPYPADRMEAFPVSRRVNSPANDSPEILEPVAP